MTENNVKIVEYYSRITKRDALCITATDSTGVSWILTNSHNIAKYHHLLCTYIAVAGHPISDEDIQKNAEYSEAEYINKYDVYKTETIIDGYRKIGAYTKCREADNWKAVKQAVTEFSMMKEIPFIKRHEADMLIHEGKEMFPNKLPAARSRHVCDYVESHVHGVIPACYTIDFEYCRFKVSHHEKVQILYRTSRAKSGRNWLVYTTVTGFTATGVTVGFGKRVPVNNIIAVIA